MTHYFNFESYILYINQWESCEKKNQQPYVQISLSLSLE